MTSARLMCAASVSDADMLYATGLFIDDPFLWWEVRGQTGVVLSPLEIDRAKPIARVDKVHANGEFLPANRPGGSFTAIIAGMAAKYKLRGFTVPPSFPAGLLEKLRREKLKITVSEQPFFPERTRKTREEIAALQTALRVAETGLRRGMDVLKASTANRRGVLQWRKSPLDLFLAGR